MSFLLVATGGFVGSILRYSLAVIMNKHFLGTWVVNITGSILLAFLYHFFMTGKIDEGWWLFAGVGFSGAYTTFSTFGNETIQMVIDKNYRTAVLYIISSFSLSIGSVVLILSLLGY